MLSVLTVHTHIHKEDSLHLRITCIFNAKSSSETTCTDLCFARDTTSSFSWAHHSGAQTTVADSVSSPSSLLLESQFHLEQ